MFDRKPAEYLAWRHFNSTVYSIDAFFILFIVNFQSGRCIDFCCWANSVHYVLALKNST